MSKKADIKPISKPSSSAPSSSESTFTISPSKAPLKVLHIIPSISPNRGGPSKAIIGMVHALRKTGLEAEIATTNEDLLTSLDVPLNQLSDYKGVPVRFFSRTTSRIRAIQEFSFSFKFSRWLKANISQYDVIHVHAIFSFLSSYSMWLARKKNIPYIVRPIGQLEDWALEQSSRKKNIYLNLIEKKNLEAASFVQFTAKSEKHQTLARFPQLTPTVIPLGIDVSDLVDVQATKPPWSINADVPVICTLSRLHPKKGLELLLNALAKITTADFQLIIAGNGEASYESSLKKRLVDLNLQNKCQFVGFVDGDLKQQLLQDSDIFALTSYSENFGIAVLEAMAKGVMPFISNEVALSDVIEHNNLGVTCDLNIDDITHKLEQQLLNKDQCKLYGIRSKAFVEQHYQWSSIADQIKTLYKNM